MSTGIDLRGGQEPAGSVTTHVSIEHATVDLDFGGDVAPTVAQMTAAFTTALGTLRLGILRNTNAGINRCWICVNDTTGWHAVTDNAAGTLPAAVVGPRTLGTTATSAAAGNHAHWVQMASTTTYINLVNTLGSPLYQGNTGAWWGDNANYRTMFTDPAATAIYGFSVQMAVMTSITTQVLTISLYVNGAEQVATRLTFQQADGGNAFKSWVAGAGAQINVPAGQIVDVRATATNRDGTARYWYLPVVRLLIGAQP